MSAVSVRLRRRGVRAARRISRHLPFPAAAPLRRQRRTAAAAHCLFSPFLAAQVPCIIISGFASLMMWLFRKCSR